MRKANFILNLLLVATIVLLLAAINKSETRKNATTKTEVVKKNTEILEQKGIN